MKSIYLIVFLSIVVGYVSAYDLYGYPTQSASTCNGGAYTGHFCAGCGGSGGTLIGNYTFKVIPTNGGIILRLDEVHITSENCASGALDTIYLNIAMPNSTQVTSPGQFSPGKQPSGYGSGQWNVPTQWSKGWGPSPLPSPPDANIQWYVGGLSPCSTLGVELHISVTDCNGQTQTGYAGGTPGGISDPGATAFTGKNWGWSLNVTDCAACKTTLQCAKVDTSCTPTTQPVSGGSSTTVVACPYIPDNTTCQALASKMDCTEGYCKSDFTCYLNAKPNGCAVQGIIPLVKCVYCNTTVCWAELGYNSQSLTANTETVVNGVVFRAITATNNIITSNARSQTFWGQPTQYVFNKLVIPAFTVFFSPSETLTWVLDGANVTIAKSGSTPCLTACEIPAQITSAAFANTDGSKTFFFAVSNNELACGFPTNFVVDLPMACQSASQISVAVSPSACLASSRPTGFATSSLNDASLDQTDLSCLATINNPFSVPLVSSSSCTDVNITINIPSSVCTVPIGIGKVSQVFPGTCSGCSTCRTLPLLGPQSDCTVTTCTQVGYVWDKTSCSCKPCSISCTSPYKLQQTAGGCSCVPCTPPTCTKGTYVKDPCDPSCTNCPTLTCTPPTYPQPLSQVTAGVCPTCIPCTTTCAANTTIDYTTCTCKPCPNTCSATQVAKNGDLCQGCTNCPTPTCAKNSTVTVSSPCTCTPCNTTCAANYVYVDPSDICKGCTPCTPPTCPKNSSLSNPSTPCTCVPCTGFPCAANYKPVDPTDSCKGCTPCSTFCDPALSLKNDPTNTCNCIPCIQPVCDPNFEQLASTTTNCTTCVPCTPPTSCNSGFYYNHSVSTCACIPCDADHCKCTVVTCPANSTADTTSTNAQCPCIPCSGTTCSANYQVDPKDTCACVQCDPASCPAGKYADPADSCNCLNCVDTVCPASFERLVPLDPCNHTCVPCVPDCVNGVNYVDPTDSCNCLPCDTVVPCPLGYTLNSNTIPCPTCETCVKTKADCGANYTVSATNPCACEICPTPVCGKGSRINPDDICSGCKDCVAVTCGFAQTPVDPLDTCSGCKNCTPISCPAGQVLVNPNDPCSICTDCAQPTCGYGQELAADLCSCNNCSTVCSAGTQIDSTGCNCLPCTNTSCPTGQTINPDDSCKCVNVTIPPPPPPPPSDCPTYYDACGVCGGKNRTCIDCSGCIGCGQNRFVDACGVVCGDGTTCPGCHGDLCSVCTKPLDLCGVCGGNSTTCYGCDGVPASGTIYDWCGVCGGNGTSCLGCDGKPNTTACSPAPIPAAAVGAISSLLALASLGAIALAAILWRMRKRPEVLFQAWENEIEDYLAEIQNNPLHNDAGNTHVSPLFELENNFHH